MGGADAWGRRHRGLRWSSLWGHEAYEGCAKMGRRRHANCATGVLGGAHCAGHEARCEGCAETRVDDGEVNPSPQRNTPRG
eukprot:3759228-Pyramimonas_sp.AAC.1